MNCKKCGKDMPDQSKFCPDCGAPSVLDTRQEVTVQRPSGVRHVTERAEPPKKKLAILAMLAGLAVAALAIFLFLNMRGPKILETDAVPNLGNTPILNTDAQPPSVEINPQEAQQVPPEVIAYLEFLKSTEQHRISLQQREVGAMTAIAATSSIEPLKEMLRELDGPMDGSPTDAAPSQQGQQAEQMLQQITTEWQTLLEDFLRVPAPEGCQTLAGKYSDALGSVVKVQIELAGAISKLDIQAANAVLPESQIVDDKLDAADGELGTVCQQFGITKSFSILSDRRKPGVLQQPGG